MIWYHCASSHYLHRLSEPCIINARYPRSRVQCAQEVRTRAYRAAEAIRHSLRNGFTAYSALSPATNSSCHRRQRIEICPSPVGPTHLRQLDISNGCQDHTVL